MRRLALSVLLAAMVGACTNAGEKLTFPALTSGQLTVAAYFDRDGSRGLSAGDTVFAGVRVALLTPGGTDTLYHGVTNAQGVAVFDSLPVGTYRVAIDRHALGDSVGVVAGDTGIVRLVTTQDSISATRVVRLGYTEVNVLQARATAAGHKVYLRAAITVPLQLFHDTSSFVVDSGASLRITDARARDGVSGNNIGDTVLVLGTMSKVNGQPVLLQGVVTTLSAGNAPTAAVVSVTDARSARSGSMDAALVQVLNTVIRDTVKSDLDFVVKVSDPADATNILSVFVDRLLGAPHAFFPIGSTMTVRGVLVPNGDNTWMLRPRNAGDLTITTPPAAVRSPR